MFKKLITLLIGLTCIIALITPVKAIENSEDIGLTCDYAVSIDAKSGLVLYNKNMNERMFPASMTKVMTVILSLNLIKDLDATTVITQSDIDTVWETGASAANFVVGETVNYWDLLYGAILPSGADATRALANNLCGSQEEFVNKMNELASELNLKDTHFVNTTGIHDPNHYTTVHDMALIVQYAIQNENFREIYAQRYHTSSNGLHMWVNKSMYNAKKAGIDTSSILGCKSGYTVEAKNCLSSLDLVNDNEIITIVGHCNNEIKPSAAVNDTLSIVSYVGANYSLQSILTKDSEVKKLNVIFAKDEQKITIKTLNDVTAFLPNNVNMEEIEYRYNFKELQAPVKKDKKLGNLKIYYQDNLLYEEEYVNNKLIEKDTVSYTINIFGDFMIPYGLAIILIIIFIFVHKLKGNKRY